MSNLTPDTWQIALFFPLPLHFGVHISAHYSSLWAWQRSLACWNVGVFYCEQKRTLLSRRLYIPGDSSVHQGARWPNITRAKVPRSLLHACDC